jgi:hypothetical protein
MPLPAAAGGTHRKSVPTITNIHEMRLVFLAVIFMVPCPPFTSPMMKSTWYR